MTRLELAETMLADAQWNLQGGRFRSAVSRAYYACYHGARACLDRRNVAVTSRDPHSATIGLFGLHLVLPGVFPPWMGRTVHELYEDRIDADYEATVDIPEPLARTVLAQAESFLEEIKAVWSRL